ncbi:hypothetical protein C6503_19420 [Candidatus Poribacteria bacterium]|nr:MAG: hypothetical protein C6503_19420 [Candidatus Poribacteria bacterium]
MKRSDLHTSITSFTDERAGIFVCFGAHLSFDRHYTAYLKHCEKRKLNPVTEDAFIDVHNRIINGLREWWYQKETGIYVIDEEGNQ